MTGNQLAYQANKERERSNRENEKETKRSNLKKEEQRGKELKETSRKNLVDQTQRLFSDAAKYGMTALGLNDKSWYNKNPQLVKDVASFSFGRPLGSHPDIPIDGALLTSDGKREEAIKYSTPGAMVLKYVSTIPAADTMKSIADKYYSEVRRANSGARNYESNDLMMYLIAISESYGQLTHASRIYAIAKTYKASNFYYARGYLKAIGMSDKCINSLLNNLANFRSRLNMMIDRINAFNIPNEFPLFNRKVWLNSNIFKDHPTKRSSNYMFVPQGIYIYDESDHSELQLKGFAYGADSSNALDDYLNQLDTMLDRILYSEDLAIMSGDILKAYDTRLVHMNSVPEDFTIPETYSLEVLSQINSATVVGYIDHDYATIYTQTNDVSSFIRQGNPKDLSSLNTLRTKSYTPGGVASTAIVGLEHQHNIVNMYKDDVTPDDVMVATRLQCNTILGSQISPGSVPAEYYSSISNRGSEIISIVSIVSSVYEQQEDGSIRAFDRYSNLYDGVAFSEITRNGSVLQGTAMSQYVTPQLSSFDWAPRIRILGARRNASPENTPFNLVYDNFDIANYMILNSDNLQNLHKVALMSLFNLSD